MPRYPTKPPQAKVHRSYLVDEVAALYDCQRSTVASWVSEGLTPIDGRYPMMFHGTTLNDFHRNRRMARKHPCGPGEIYCVVCRVAQTPAGGMVDYEPQTEKLGTVMAICPQCGRLIRQAVGKERLHYFMSRCTVTYRAQSNVLGHPLPTAKTEHLPKVISE